VTVGVRKGEREGNQVEAKRKKGEKGKAILNRVIEEIYDFAGRIGKWRIPLNVHRIVIVSARGRRVLCAALILRARGFPVGTVSMSAAWAEVCLGERICLAG
jgi:hypothetical protein